MLNQGHLRHRLVSGVSAPDGWLQLRPALRAQSVVQKRRILDAEVLRLTTADDLPWRGSGWAGGCVAVVIVELRRSAASGHRQDDQAGCDLAGHTYKAFSSTQSARQQVCSGEFRLKAD